METEDLVAAAARFANGALGTIEATTAAYPGFPERIELIGASGTAMLAGTELEVRLQDGEGADVAPDASAGGTGADPMAFPHDYHRAVIADFLDAIEARREPRVNGRRGAARASPRRRAARGGRERATGHGRDEAENENAIE